MPNKSTIVLAARLMDYGFVGSRRVPITVAEEIRTGTSANKRPIDAIDQKILRQTIERVKDAAASETLLSKEEKEQVESMTVTSLQHASEDPEEHSTVLFEKEDKKIFKKHVPDRPGENVRRIP